ncbi:MAG: prepilin-type N-terminal cleavage/methylation domain-containing protein [Planctomycetota bacterium]
MHTQLRPLPSVAAARQRAFTLIELLVVISIIALLIGILLPALGAARGVAQDVKCLSNSRQIGTAVTTYATDNQDFNVPYRIGWTGGDRIYWTAILVNENYMDLGEGMICPKMEEDGFSEWSIKDIGFNTSGSSGDVQATSAEPLQSGDNAEIGSPEWLTDGDWLRAHYAMNTSNVGTVQRRSGFVNYVIDQPNEYGGVQFTERTLTPRLSDFRSPSEMYFAMDGAAATGITWPAASAGGGGRGGAGSFPEGNATEPETLAGSNFVWDMSSGSNVGSSGMPHARHSGNSINITYADGHSAAVSVPGAPNALSSRTLSLAYSDDEVLGDSRLDERNGWTETGGIINTAGYSEP